MKKAIVTLFLMAVFSLTMFAGDSHQGGESYLGPDEFWQTTETSVVSETAEQQPLTQESTNTKEILIFFDLDLLRQFFFMGL